MGRIVTLAAAAVLLAGCGTMGAPPPPPDPSAAASPDPTAAPPPPRPTRREAATRCAAGLLAVGDIPAIDEEWRAGLAAAEERARAWRADARLVAFRVACEPLEPAFRWQGRFYSDTAQSFFESDSGRSTPAEVDPAQVQTLPREQITFLELHRALARAGYADDRVLGASGGIGVRLNGPSDPFGPPETPPGIVYHVAAVEGADLIDLFVGGDDWTVRTYVAQPAG